MAKKPLNEGVVQHALQSIYNALIRGVSLSSKKVADPELRDLLKRAEETQKSLDKYMTDYYSRNPKEKKQLDFLKTKVFTR